MIRFSKIWSWVVVTGIVILAASITNLFAQMNDVHVSEETKLLEDVNKVDPATKVEPQPKDPVSRPPVVNINSATAVDIQRGFNELKSEYLDDRADYIDMWLAVIAIVLTFFGLVVVVLGYFGFKRFKELEADAKEYVKEIERHREQSEAHLREITSIDIGDPDKAAEVEKAIQDVQSDPEPSLIDKVITEIYTLQRNDRVDDAIEKWRSIANIAEGTDNDLASRAWLSIAYLLPEGNDQLTAYDKAMDLNPDFTRDPKNQPISKSSKFFHDTIVVGAVLRYFNDPKFEKFSTTREYIIGSDRYEADIVLHDGEGQLAVVVECKVNEYIPAITMTHLKERFRRSGAQFGLLTAGTDLSKWTFFRILGDEITEITRSQFEEGVLESGSS